MAVLDSLLGGSGESSEQRLDVGADVATSPEVALQASDVDVAGLVGVGDLGLGAEVPLLASADVTHEGDGGLLSGLL